MIEQLITNRLKNINGNSILEKVNNFEQTYDKQFKAIYNIIIKYPDLKGDILFGIIQNALISYQLSGNGEKRWEEFSFYILDNIDTFLSNNCLFWQNLLNTCKYNCRFKKVKLDRIKKTLSLYKIIKNDWKKLYKNMIELNKLLAFTMKQNLSDKTIVFAVKMFGYGARIKYNFIPYPFEIDIPVDSRIKKIYIEETKKNSKNSEIRKFFSQLGKKLGIPPLHLDSLLWVKESF